MGGGLSASNGSSGSGSGSLPSPDAVKMPKTVEEAEKMVELGEKMISFALEAAASLSQPEREALKAVFSTIVIKMKAKRGMSSSSQTNNGHSNLGGGNRVLSQPRNSRSPSPPVKRERRSSRSPTRREGSSRSSWGERGSRDHRGSREERNGFLGNGSRGSGSGSFEGRRGRD